MKIHTNELDTTDIWSAIEDANRNLESEEGIVPIFAERLEYAGSRSHEYAFDIVLSGDSSRNAMHKEFKSATWDQWGEFIAGLYERESGILMPLYVSRKHFHYTTTGRFALGGNFEYHRKHKWTRTGGGAPDMSQCSGCGALHRAVNWNAKTDTLI